jgi:hypothetical protein
VAQDLPPARAVHHRDVDPLDIHRRQGRDRVETACPRDIEMRVARAAPASKLTRGGGRSLRFAVRRDGEALHLHPHDRVGVALVLRALRQLLLLPAIETRRVCPMGFVEIAGPQIIGLHHVEVAIHDQITLTRHF